MTHSTHIYGDVPHVPKAVSLYMSKLAHKANKAMRGTKTAKVRAQKAADARWSKKRKKK